MFEYQSAHHIFKQFHAQYGMESQFLHEFSQVKIKLAERASSDIKELLYTEAEQLLREALAVGLIETQKAWYWFDLAKLLIATEQDPVSIEQAFKKAVELLPRESLFKRFYDNWKS